MTKFKLIRQHDAMECGVASLAMICTYYGKNISIYDLSKICLPTQEGVSLKGLKDDDDDRMRSQKVRVLLGEIPPALVRWGTIIISVVFTALIAAVCLLPYPYSDGESIIRHIILNL